MDRKHERTMFAALIVVTPRHLVTATWADDGDDFIQFEINGHQFNSKQLPGKPENRRRWALGQAIKFANAHPEMGFTLEQITEAPERLLAWLDKTPGRQTPPTPTEGGVTFA